jgi:PadR family transcriptional regulator, regulatory protein PadR
MKQGQQSEGACASPKGFVRHCILLLLEESPAHGYELMDRLKPFGLELTGAGPVYRALRSLQEAELVDPQWDTAGKGPARRVYELTPKGRQALEDHATELLALSEWVFDYLARLRNVRLHCGPANQRAYEVLVETKLSVEASDEGAARQAVEHAFAKPWQLYDGVWSKGPVWVYEATVEADA